MRVLFTSIICVTFYAGSATAEDQNRYAACVSKESANDLNAPIDQIAKTCSPFADEVINYCVAQNMGNEGDCRSLLGMLTAKLYEKARGVQ